MVLCESEDIFGSDFEMTTLDLLNSCQVHLPNLNGGVFLETGIVETDVNTGSERGIKETNSVSCQEENTLQYSKLAIRLDYKMITYAVVLKSSQENRDDRVPFDIGFVSLLQEYVCFVQK